MFVRRRRRGIERRAYKAHRVSSTASPPVIDLHLVPSSARLHTSDPQLFGWSCHHPDELSAKETIFKAVIQNRGYAVN